MTKTSRLQLPGDEAGGATNIRKQRIQCQIEKRRRSTVRTSSFAGFNGRHELAKLFKPPETLRKSTKKPRPLPPMCSSAPHPDDIVPETGITTRVDDDRLHAMSEQPLYLSYGSGMSPQYDDQGIREEDIMSDDDQFVQDGLDNTDDEDLSQSTTLQTLQTPTPRDIRKRMMKIVSWQKLLAFLTTTGNARFSSFQYTVMASAILTANEDRRLATYKTIRTCMRKHLAKWCLPRQRLFKVPRIRESTQSGRCQNVQTVNSNEPCDPSVVANVIFASEWAKMDVGYLPFYRSVYECDERMRNHFANIENSPIVNGKAAAVCADITMYAYVRGMVLPVKYGDHVSFSCDVVPQTADGRDVTQFGWDVEDADVPSHSAIVHGLVGSVWCVSSKRHQPTDLPSGSERWTQEEQDAYSAICQSQDSTICLRARTKRHESRPSRMTLQQRLKQRESTCAPTSPHHIHVTAGDVCMFIKPNREENQPQIICIFRASYVDQAFGHPAERLHWVSTAQDDSGEVVLREVAVTTITDLPTLVSDSSCLDNVHTAPNRGVLHNGERYVIYRIALYADGFNQRKSSDEKSVSGCYLLPLGLPPEERSSPSAARVITIAPFGVDENDALNTILQDIQVAATDGIQGVDPYGKSVRIFVDPLGFFGDYPAASAMSDCMGHSADAYCNLCGVRRRKGTNGPQILHTSKVHSRRLGYMRFEERMRAIRDSNPSKRSLELMGMQCDTHEAAMRHTAVRITNMIGKSQTRFRTDANIPVLTPRFDSYLSIAAVPDHLLDGLSKDALSLCFSQLSDDECRMRVEGQIMSAVSLNGLPKSGNILKWEKNGGYKGLHNMTMKQRRCVVLCAASIFKQEYRRTQNRSFLLMSKLQNLISAIYRWPSQVAEGDYFVDYSEHGKIALYHKSVSTATEEYISTTASIVEDIGGTAFVLDKPNAHRAIELQLHTIPIFNHARNCSELILEMVHRSFKDWLQENRNSDAHLTAVENGAAKDWMSRILILHKMWTNGTCDDKRMADLGLRRLLLGRDVVDLDESRADYTDILRCFHERLTDCFREPVSLLLNHCGGVSTSIHDSFHWTGVINKNMERSELIDSAVLILRDVSPSTVLDFSEEIGVCRMAQFVSADPYGGRQRSYPHHSVCIGDAVSLVVKEDSEGASFLRSVDDGSGIRKIYVIHAIFSSKDFVWGVGKEMRQWGRGMSSRSSHHKIFKFGASVRRVALIHVCDNMCKLGGIGQSMRHSKSAIDGGVYKVLTRVEGYPPHMS